MRCSASCRRERPTCATNCQRCRRASTSCLARTPARPAGLVAADEIAQQVDQAGLLYDPEMNTEVVRAALRAAAETGRAQQYTENAFQMARAIGEEMKRYGPAGNDEHRERWEQKMDDADIEIAERAYALADPDAAAARALRSRAFERAETSPLEAALDQEFENMKQFSSEAPHRKAMHEANVAEWERTHDSAGRETVNKAEEFYERGR